MVACSGLPERVRSMEGLGGSLTKRRNEMNTEQEIDDEVCAIMMEYGPDGHVDGHDLLTVLVLRRVAAERERCAKMCEDSDTFEYDDPGGFFAGLIRKTPNVADERQPKAQP